MKKLISLIPIIFIFLMGINPVQALVSEEQKQEIKALYNSNNLEEAYSMISKITEAERDYELWYLLGNLAQDFDNEINASFFLQKSLMLNPANDKAHYNLGNIYLNQKKYNSAINEYKLAIKYKKDYAYYYYNMGCSYLGLKNYKEAKKAFEKAIKLKNDDADFYYNLAFSYKNLNNKIEAEKALKKYDELKEEDK